MADRRRFSGGYAAYGRSLGVVLLDATFPRPPGDVGNARTFDYPVAYEVVEGASPERVVRDGDLSLLDPFVEAGQRLVHRGAVAVTTSCGFLLPFQREMADRLDVPVFTSSLLQIPTVAAGLPSDRVIGVLTADEQSLERLDHPILAEFDDRLVVEGLADAPRFQAAIIEGTEDALDLDAVGEEVAQAAQRLAGVDDLGAVILECTNLRPYLDRIIEACGVPVYDFLTLADLAWRAAEVTRY